MRYVRPLLWGLVLVLGVLSFRQWYPRSEYGKDLRLERWAENERRRFGSFGQKSMKKALEAGGPGLRNIDAELKAFYSENWDLIKDHSRIFSTQNAVPDDIIRLLRAKSKTYRRAFREYEAALDQEVPFRRLQWHEDFKREFVGHKIDGEEVGKAIFLIHRLRREESMRPYRDRVILVEMDRMQFITEACGDVAEVVSRSKRKRQRSRSLIEACMLAGKWRHRGPFEEFVLNGYMHFDTEIEMQAIKQGGGTDIQRFFLNHPAFQEPFSFAINIEDFVDEIILEMKTQDAANEKPKIMWHKAAKRESI